MNKIIAFAGLRNSGKDTVANMAMYILNTPKFMHNFFFYKYLPSIYNKWTQVAFADKLKQMLSVLLNVNVKSFDNRFFKENVYYNLKNHNITFKSDNKISDKTFNKILSTDPSKLLDKSLTIRQLMQYYGSNIMRKYFGDTLWIDSSLQHINSNVIISDLRFRVEEEAVHKFNGTIIYIERPETKPGNHASEKEVIQLKEENKFDYIILNYGTLKELFYQTKYILRKIK